MWKAIFIESCLLSALIFGGFYIHSKVIKDEIDLSGESIKEQSIQQKFTHISGNSLDNLETHLSGNVSKKSTAHISGLLQQHTIKKNKNP